MNRDIKFRAWGKEEKIMQENIQDRSDFKYFLNNKNIEVMQYSGITDVTGKEIYEGDIVEFYNDVDYTLHPGIAKIVFDLGAFQMVNEKYGTEYLGNMDIYGMDIRVAGNIFENPELLESEAEQ